MNLRTSTAALAAALVLASGGTAVAVADTSPGTPTPTVTGTPAAAPTTTVPTPTKTVARRQTATPTAQLTGAPQMHGGRAKAPSLPKSVTGVRLAAVNPGTSSITPITYGSSASQHADLYVPDGTPPVGGWPVVIAVHGGSFFNGSTTNTAAVSEKWASEGFAVVNMEYRNGYETRWPAPRIDFGLVVKWVKDHAGLELNAGKIAAYGFSAGATIAATGAGYYTGNATYGGVKAVVTVSGVMQPLRNMNLSEHPEGLSGDPWTLDNVRLSQWIAGSIGCANYPTWDTCGARFDEIQPQTYFDAAGPSILMYQGSADKSVPPSTLGAMDYWLNLAGQKHKAVMVTGMAHDETILTGSATRWAEAVAYVRTALG